MSDLFDKHISLVEAVNNARTHAEHRDAEQRLSGFRDAIDCMKPPPEHLIKCDLHYLARGIDRPMCCGVWLDWEPSEAGG